MSASLSSQSATPAIHPDPEVNEALTLAERLAEKMAQRWRAGERPRVEEYLALHPQLGDWPEAVLELIYEEICLRQESREEVAVADLVRRFPRWRRQVQALLNCHYLLADRLAPRFPSAGEAVGDFHLLAELGRGAHGRVFLATQSALADRPVVLKMQPRSSGEHLSLARLQHTHIVPLHSVHDYPALGLQALCLPYFGGVTLARLLDHLRERPPGKRTGSDILHALQMVQADAPLGGIIGGPACRFLARASYVQAVCWVGTCLADALRYAHERRLVHLDLKPSNVLLATDGQPMLLDFHLAREPVPAGASAPEWLGGTPDYMPPEQQAALEAVWKRCRVPSSVDGRADVYALGVLLYEALGGSLPGPVAPAQALRRCNPHVSTGLAGLLAKCLARDPEERYPDAGNLAADLRLHLADLPLRGVANRSLVERWQKWRRRRPYALPLLGLILSVMVAGSLLLEHVSRQTDRVRVALRNGQDHLNRQRFAEALDSFRHGVALAEDLPCSPKLGRQLREQLGQAVRGQAARELHLFCEGIRPLYRADLLPPAQARAVAAHCRTFWNKRSLIAHQLGPQLAGGLEQQVRDDLLDLATVWANLRVRLAPRDEARAAREEVLELLAQAEALFGPSCVLCLERRSHALALGRTDVAEAAAQQASELAPRSAWEHCALGRAYLGAGDVTRAAAQIERAVDLQPQALWPNFYQGSCAYCQGRYEDAVVAFSVCVALGPQSAWCYYNRGLAFAELGRLDRALRDYDHALQLDPTLAAAYLSRGTVHYRRKRYPDALADLERALEQGADGAAVNYNRALVHLSWQDRPTARTCLCQALRYNPEHRQAMELLIRLEQDR
jgi:serine/threonine protein kinase/Flp pilus assembly protein TadD